MGSSKQPANDKLTNGSFTNWKNIDFVKVFFVHWEKFWQRNHYHEKNSISSFRSHSIVSKSRIQAYAYAVRAQEYIVLLSQCSHALSA